MQLLKGIGFMRSYGDANTRGASDREQVLHSAPLGPCKTEKDFHMKLLAVVTCSSELDIGTSGSSNDPQKGPKGHRREVKDWEQCILGASCKGKYINAIFEIIL